MQEKLNVQKKMIFRHCWLKDFMPQTKKSILMVAFASLGLVTANKAYADENELVYTNVATMSAQGVAQANHQLMGTVVDANGEPIIGATIKVKGTNIGAITDIDGNFSLKLDNANPTIEVSFVGYQTQILKASANKKLSIILQDDNQLLEEIVVVGYGAVKKKDLTGSVASISSSKISEVPVLNASQALQGRVAGVLVTNSSWAPGSNPSVLIRGKRSIKASNDPLYVVDGIPMTGGIDQIPPGDIESMDVLKDASATAIYGARGANGVILITTKKGKDGKTQVDYNGYFGVQTIARKNELMNGAEYAEYVRESYRAGGLYNSAVPNRDLDYLICNSFGGNSVSLDAAPRDPYTWESIQMAYDANGNYDPSKVRDISWEDAVERTGIVTDHQLTIRGGSAKTNYLLGANYYKNEGIYKDQDYQRFGVRLNLNHEVNNWLKVGVQTQMTRSLHNRGANLQNNWRVNPLGRLYDEKGQLTEMTSGEDTQWWNPLQYLVPGALDSRKKVTRFMGSYYGEVKLPLDGLRYRLNAGIDYIATQDYSFNASNTRTNMDNQAKNATANRYMWTIENLLYYDKTVGKHNIGVTLLQSVQRDVNESNEIMVEDLPSDQLYWYDVASGLVLNKIGSNHSVWSLASFMARLNYNFNSRYYATVSARYDGSSRLADGHKWVAFPAVALAWRVNEENFLKNVSWLDNLKLRLGYGVTANTSIDPYQTKGTLSKIYYNFGENHVIGYAPGGLPNAALTWETTGQWNVGIDFGFFKNRIMGTIDFYRQDTSDLLLDRQIPVVSGFENVLSNIGKTRNQGVEISLTTVNLQSRDFTWTTDWMFTTNKEEIVELFNGATDDVGNSWFIGQSVNVFYDLKKIGIWQNTQEDLDEMAKYNKNGHQYEPGMIKLQDKNGDYKINSEDRYILGQDRPKHTFSFINTFNYKNWDLSVFLYGAIGGMAKNEVRYGHQASRNNTLKYDYWTPNNPTNAYPRPISNKETENESALYYEKTDFMRIKNVTLGYTFPKALIQKASLSNCRIYLTAQNPFIVTSFTGVDPEGARGWASPSISTWMIGANLSF